MGTGPISKLQPPRPLVVEGQETDRVSMPKLTPKQKAARAKEIAKAAREVLFTPPNPLDLGHDDPRFVSPGPQGKEVDTSWFRDASKAKRFADMSRTAGGHPTKTQKVGELTAVSVEAPVPNDNVSVVVDRKTGWAGGSTGKETKQFSDADEAIKYARGLQSSGAGRVTDVATKDDAVVITLSEP